MKRKKWSKSVGARPNRVRVLERKAGGCLYCEWREGSRERRQSFGHRDRQAAVAFALELSARLARGEEDARAGRLSWGRLFSLYRERRTPLKGGKSQAADDRRIVLWSRFLGGSTEVAKLRRAEWDDFIRLRRSGELGADGKRVAEADQRAVRDRTVEADQRWLMAVLHWGTTWQDREGRYLLRENPARGFPVVKERNPRQAVASEDRYQALRAVADRVTFEVHATVEDAEGKKKRKRTQVRSYLPEILDLANESGRRISAILALKYEDVNLDRRPAYPHGSITWSAENDKQKRDWKDVPLTARARAAIDRVLSDRPGIGAAPLFPSPKDPTKPMDRYLADRWLRKAEKLAKLETQEGSLWHAFRRKAATELKGAPDKDVMGLLGWTDLRSLKACYQHADPESMLMALQSRRELREVAR